jgi:SPP1 family predicted phage head-tail adaptor
MNIAGLRVRITIRQNSTKTDEVGNHVSKWQDIFSCWASVSSSGKADEEDEAAGATRERSRVDFTVRWSSETAAIRPKEHRIVLGGRVYNIIGVDEMGFRHKSRKLHAELTEVHE